MAYADRAVVYGSSAEYVLLSRKSLALATATFSSWTKQDKEHDGTVVVFFFFFKCVILQAGVQMLERGVDGNCPANTRQIKELCKLTTASSIQTQLLNNHSFRPLNS